MVPNILPNPKKSTWFPQQKIHHVFFREVIGGTLGDRGEKLRSWLTLSSFLGAALNLATRVGFSYFCWPQVEIEAQKKSTHTFFVDKVQWGNREPNSKIFEVVDCSSTVGFGCLSTPSRMDRRTGDTKSAGQWYGVLAANRCVCIETVAQTRYEPKSSWHYMMKLSLDTVYNGMNVMAVSHSLICFTFWKECFHVSTITFPARLVVVTVWQGLASSSRWLDDQCRGIRMKPFFQKGF